MNLDFIQDDNFGKYVPEETPINDKLKELVLAIGKKYEPKFEIKTDFDKWLYLNLTYYFSDNSKCEWDLSKGLFFHGNKGTGKSLSLKIFKKLFFYKSKHGFLQGRKNFGFFGMESMKGNTDQFRKLCEKSLFCDEVMRETKDDSKIVNDYGTKEQPFSTGLHQMNRNFCDKGMIYHFTTNYWSARGGDAFSSVYGAEIHDRLNEMCNFVEFKGETKRK